MKGNINFEYYNIVTIPFLECICEWFSYEFWTYLSCSWININIILIRIVINNIYINNNN